MARMTKKAVMRALKRLHAACEIEENLKGHAALCRLYMDRLEKVEYDSRDYAVLVVKISQLSDLVISELQKGQLN